MQNFMFLCYFISRSQWKIRKQLNEGFKRPVYWNKYKVMDNKVVEITAANTEKHNTELLDSSSQGVKRLFVLAYDNRAGKKQVSDNSFKKYFLPRFKIENYNIEIDGRNFYDQPINDSIKQYGEVRKVSTGQGDDYTTGCLLDFALDADSRAIQQIIFTCIIKSTEANTRVTISYILEQ